VCQLRKYVPLANAPALEIATRDSGPQQSKGILKFLAITEGIDFSGEHRIVLQKRHNALRGCYGASGFMPWARFRSAAPRDQQRDKNEPIEECNLSKLWTHAPIGEIFCHPALECANGFRYMTMTFLNRLYKSAAFLLLVASSVNAQSTRATRDLYLDNEGIRFRDCNPPLIGTLHTVHLQYDEHIFSIWVELKSGRFETQCRFSQAHAVWFFVYCVWHLVLS
jgi:hypothetical protein